MRTYAWLRTAGPEVTRIAVVELREVTRRFGTLTAVDCLNLEVEPGQTVVLLGHNGAGKTTLLRVLNGLLRADGGEVRVHGLDPMVNGHQVRARTGVLTEYPALEAYHSTRENLEVHAAVHGLPRAIARDRIALLLDRLGLAGKADVLSRELSAGLKQRVALARALLHEPDLLLLDEPTSTIDPVAAREVRELILEASHSQGRAVLLLTHNLTEAEALADRIVIIRSGRLVLEGTPASLRHGASGPRAARLTTVPREQARLLAALAPHGSVRVVDADTVEVDLPMNGQRTDPEGSVRRVSRLVQDALAAGIPVYRVTPVETTLEDCYLALHADEVEADLATGRTPSSPTSRRPER